MIRFVFVLAQLFATSSFAAQNPAWPKAMVNDLKTKTLQQTFCEKSPGFETKAFCDYFAKDKIALSQKLVSATANGSVLILNDGKRAVEIKRLKSAVQFEINKKIIDVSELRTPAQVLAAIEKALPKVATRSLWMNSAYAQEGVNSEVYTIMQSASAAALFKAVDESTCQSLDEFIQACEIHIQAEPEYFEDKSASASKNEKEKPVRKILRNQKITQEEFDMAKRDFESLALKIYKMKEVTFGLINRAREANSYCKQNGWKDIGGKMESCLVDLKKLGESYIQYNCAMSDIDQKDCENTRIAFARKLDLQQEKNNNIKPRGSSQTNPSVR